MSNLDDFKSDDPIAWCPGCGDFGILNAVKKAFVDLQLRPRDICMVSGIGQAAKLPHYLKANVFNGLHGRTLPVAFGIKLANPRLTVIAEGGDGDGYAEGGNHFLHALRRNVNITYLVHDNRVFALTKGQTSPTSDAGYKSATSPWGAVAEPFRPLAVAVTHEAAFVARGFAGDIEHLASLICDAIRCEGFSFIDILQPCVTFNKVNTFQWYKDRVYKLTDETHNPRDRAAALEKTFEWGERIPIGVIFRGAHPPYEAAVPALKNGFVPVDAANSPGDIDKVMKEFY